MPLIDRVDVVAGYRINRQRRRHPAGGRAGMELLVRALFYVPVRDIDCAFKLFRRERVRRDRPRERRRDGQDRADGQARPGRAAASSRSASTTIPAGPARPGGSSSRSCCARSTSWPRCTGAGPDQVLTTPAGDGRPVARGSWTRTIRRPLPGPRRDAARRHRRRRDRRGRVRRCALPRPASRSSLVERTDRLGGLVVSFEVAGTPLECFYHHVFPHETEIIGLIAESGWATKLGWFRSTVGVLVDGRVWPFTSPPTCCGSARCRCSTASGPASARCAWRGRRTGRTRRDHRASTGWRGYTGPNARRVVWEPLLRAKFGPAAGDGARGVDVGAVPPARRRPEAAAARARLPARRVPPAVRRARRGAATRPASTSAWTRARAASWSTAGASAASHDSAASAGGRRRAVRRAPPRLAALVPERCATRGGGDRRARASCASCSNSTAGRRTSTGPTCATRRLPFGGIIEHTNMVPGERLRRPPRRLPEPLLHARRADGDGRPRRPRPPGGSRSSPSTFPASPPTPS